MHLNTKKLLMAAAIASVIGAGIFTTTTYAQDMGNPEDTFIDRLAERFDLNRNEVNDFFIEMNEEHHAEMEKKNEERLSALVKEGKLTEDQKTLILKKHDEMKAEMEAQKDDLKDMTPEERRAKMEEHRAEIDTWAKENGIDPDLMLFKVQFKGGHMGPEGQGMGDKMFLSK